MEKNAKGTSVNEVNPKEQKERGRYWTLKRMECKGLMDWKNQLRR
jgi:hypothetical protein